MRQLTDPIVETRAEKQYISQGQYHLALDENGDIDLANSYYRVWITDLPSGEHAMKQVMVPQLPAALKQALKTLHLEGTAAAEAAGLLKPGVDTDDLP